MAKVPQHLERLAREVKEMLDTVTKSKGKTGKELAFQLGELEMTISHWGNHALPNRHMPAYFVPEFCRVLEDWRLLDLLEDTAGRSGTVFVPYTLIFGGTQDIKVVQSLIKEVGEALQTLANTLENGLVEDHEYPDAIRELNDVIIECAKLKKWLKDRLETDRLKIMQKKQQA